MTTARQTSASRPPADSCSSAYYTLRVPVLVVTAKTGRIYFRDSRDLFRGLEALVARGDALMAVWQGNSHVHAAGVDALQAMLDTVGLTPFRRRCQAREGPERASMSKWAWDYLAEYLG